MSFSADDYRAVRARVAKSYRADIARVEALRPPAGETEFARAVVSIMAGMDPAAMGSEASFEGVTALVREHRRSIRTSGIDSTGSLSRAILDTWQSRDRLFDQYRALEDDAARLAFIGGLPFVDEAATWRVAQAFGIPRTRAGGHLATIAAVLSETPEGFCSRLAEESGDSAAVVDVVLWRAVERGWLDMRTLRMRRRGVALGARTFRSAQSEAAIHGTAAELFGATAEAGGPEDDAPIAPPPALPKSG